MKLKTKTKQIIWCIILTLGLILFFATGCKTKYVPIEYKTTEYRDRHVRDSVFFRDTTRIHTSGDTVFVDVVRWRDRWHTRRDSVIVTDSIPIIVEVPVEVNRLTWWQQTRLKLFNVALIVFLILIFIRFIRK